MDRCCARSSLLVLFLCAGAPRDAVAAPDSTAQTPTAQTHYKKGMAAYALEDWDGAIAEFEAGFRDEPLPAFLYNIAQAHRQAKRPEMAVRFYRKYLELSPDDAPDRAEVQQLTADLERAIAAQRDALEKPPTGAAPPGSAPSGRTGASGPLVAGAAPAPEAPRTDSVGLALIVVGGVIAVAGVGLAAYGAVADKQANSHSVTTDLGDRQTLESRANSTAVGGYVAIGVGAALAVTGGVKLALGKRANKVAFLVGGSPGGAFVSAAGSF